MKACTFLGCRCVLRGIIMKTGVFLPGGGAKGAFQAGALLALKSRGVKFDIIAGTSIGAINGYFVFTDTISVLEDTWLKFEWDALENIRKNDDIIENKEFLNLLSMMPLDAVNDRKMFVNYIHIQNGRMTEIHDEISQYDQMTQLEKIGYSSLLPRSKESQGDNLTLENAFILKSFLREMVKGKYDDMYMDGGLYNNTFLEPFIDNEVDRIFCIVFEKNYELPQYITDKYDESQIYLIEPPEEFGNDTLRFDMEFRKKWFECGFHLVKEMDIHVNDK